MICDLNFNAIFTLSAARVFTFSFELRVWLVLASFLSIVQAGRTSTPTMHFAHFSTGWPSQNGTHKNFE